MQALFQWLEKELNIKKQEDWYLVTKSQLEVLGAYFAITKNGGLFTILKKMYPDYDWDENKRNIIGKSQLALHRSIQDLFPREQVHSNFIHPALEFANKEKMELDVFIPNLKLAFEYQGKQHFNQSYFLTGESKQYLLDIQKREACKAAGITLIEVPYWWDFSVKSLISLIKQHRPELFKENDSSSQIIPSISAGKLSIPFYKHPGLQQGQIWPSQGTQ